MKTAISLPRNIIYILQYYKHCKNGELFWKLTIFEIFCHNLCSSKQKRKHSPTRYNLSNFIVFRNVVSMLNCALNASSVVYTTINYFISRSIMSDFFTSHAEPMDIEGEAVCAVGPQVVTAGGEQGAGVEDNGGFSERRRIPSCSLTRENPRTTRNR